MLVFWSCAQASSCQCVWFVHYQSGGISPMFAAPAGMSCLSPLLNSAAASFVQFNSRPTGDLLMSSHTTRLSFTASRRRRRNGVDDACGLPLNEAVEQVSGTPRVSRHQETAIRRSPKASILPVRRINRVGSNAESVPSLRRGLAFRGRLREVIVENLLRVDDNRNCRPWLC